MPKLNGNVNDAALLAAALEGLEAQKRRIEEQIIQVQRMLGHRRGRPPAVHSTEDRAATTPAQKRPMSAASRKRIATAQKRRWAEYHKRVAAAKK